ncbi:MAG: chromate transporter [Bacillota bacterium]|nr:chromate transporter [Bacillota bacterium]MDW7676826.1 chromate transporter [Bacillota bacterium]
MIYFLLLYTFAKIGLFTFGGGYAMLPLITREVVHSHAWISAAGLVDMIAIAQMSPGPIAINLATFIGFDQAGFWGSVMATFGVVFFTAMLVLVAAKALMAHPDHIITRGFFKGIRPAVISFVAAAILSLYPVSVPDLKSFALMLAAFLAFGKFKLPPIPIVLVAGVIAVFLF